MDAFAYVSMAKPRGYNGAPALRTSMARKHSHSGDQCHRTHVTYKKETLNALISTLSIQLTMAPSKPSAVEIVQNLDALYAANRVSNDKLQIDCSKGQFIQIVAEGGNSPLYDPTTQILYLTKSFYNNLQDLLELLDDFDLLDANAEERAVETKLLVRSCGMERTEERAKLLSAKALFTTARLAYMSVEEDGKIRQAQGDSMIRSGSFQSWDDIKAYKDVQDVLDL
ncbi:hypothetical protein FA13DRAFT_1111767 [Coprinellus micaceus]|uniref:Uncharacterized protein n=1 Tax=Coprinellus micaceus TaxID=71717 RepID=A0A4Y7SWA1_COPMI|nr:hypothetical protein FA13DRAFT_1111767 [Coprinellus micaceus]